MVMAIIAVVLAIVLSNKIRSDAMDALVEEAVGSARGRLLRAITPADLEVPMHGERYDRFHAFVQESIVSERTARVKLWAKDGTVIYSNDPAGIGQKFPTKPSLLKALHGENAIEVKIPKDPENARERFLGTLMEVYTPIIFPGTTVPQGAFEIYQYYEPTAQRITDLRHWTFGAIGAGFVVLYGGLVSIVWGGWRTIQQQQTALGKTNAELREAHGELLRTNAQLKAEIAERQRVEEELRAFAAHLQRSNRELQDFAQVSSHDLQEPLRKIQTFSDRLKTRCDEALDDQGRDYLARLQQAASRMQHLINDLLTFSRVTTKAQPFVPVDLAEVAQEVISDLEVHIEQVSGRVEVGALPTIEADPLQMHQLLQNLMSNALKFHRKEASPVVQISGQSFPRQAPHASETPPVTALCQIMVADNGIGFDEKYLDRIFTPFQRLHGREEYEGTGIGLAVCRKIVERHGGSITAQSTPGQGATFIVTLPVTQPNRDTVTCLDPVSPGQGLDEGKNGTDLVF
jgi:signal transduction histidine kinase